MPKVTNITTHTAETGQAWTLSGGFTNKIKIQGNTAQLVSGADGNNWRMAIATDVIDDSFDLSTDYKRGSVDAPGEYVQLEFLAQSGANPPQDRVYVAFTRTAATTVQVRLIRTKAFSFAQSIILDSAFPLATDSSKRIGVSVSGLQVQTWWEPAGGGTRTNIGSAVTLTQDYRDGTHKRVAFNFIGAQAAGAGSPRIDNFTVRGPAPADTSRPPIPTSLDLPGDSSLTVEDPPYARIDLLYYRNIVGIVFDDSTSGVTVRDLFARYDATVIGGVPGLSEYVVQVPDPGSTLSALDSLVAAVHDQPGVKQASPVYYRTPGSLYWRHPNDGPGMKRGDWFASTDGTRALTAIRAPLAWGCETGAYTQARVPVGVVDFVFDGNQPDLVGLRVLPPPLSAPPPPDARIVSDTFYRSHGTGVTGVLTATGNNDAMITGVLWQSGLVMYSYSRDTWVFPDLSRLFDGIMRDAVARGVRVLVISHGIGDVRKDAHVAGLKASMQAYLDAGGLLVLATGQTPNQPGLTLTLDQLAQTQNTRLHALHRAAAELYSSGYANSIIFVGGTDDTGAFWTGSNYWTGATVLAPATSILTLANTADFAAGTWLVSGTSFSAPYVGGVAGLLLAMDPTLTAAQVKSYIVRGDSQPRLNPQTGQIGRPPPVAGAPERAYQLDAYGALTLLASERPGISLCGNRTWVAGGTVWAQRDTAPPSTEQLTALGESAAYVNVRHGGRRLEVSASSGDRAFELRLGQWVETQDTATTPYGGTFLSLFQLSHDRDSSVQVLPHYGDGFVDLQVLIRQGTGAPTTIKTIHVALPVSASWACDVIPGDCRDSVFTGSNTVADWRYAYSPVGDKVFVAVTLLADATLNSSYSGCPWEGAVGDCITVSYRTTTDHTDVHAISISNGNDQVLWSVPGRQVYWIAQAEDGAQFVGAEASMTQDYVFEPIPGSIQAPWFHTVSQPQVVSGCSIVWRAGVATAPQRYSIPTDDACRGLEGQGTVSPVARPSP